jgi:membrane protein implicated in regulation of membrane protease activity
MPWWIWVVLGAGLLAAELFVPLDFYLVFLGVAGLLVGAASGLGLVTTASGQWALFGVVAAVSLLTLRRVLRDRFHVQGGDPRVDDTLVGEVATASEEIAPGAIGRVELRGTVWTGRNSGERALRIGQRARVESVDGLTLCVRSEE